MKRISEQDIIRIRFIEMIERHGWRDFSCPSLEHSNGGTLELLRQRAENCSRQIEAEHGFSIDRFYSGLNLGRIGIILGIALLLFLSGVLTNYLTADGRVNLLFNAVIGYVLWSMFIYAFMALRSVLFKALVPMGTAANSVSLFGRYLQRGALAIRNTLFSTRQEEEGLSGILTKTISAAGRGLGRYYLWQFRSSTHIWSMSLAAGIVAGLYLRGLAVSYQFFWESTFIETPAFVEQVMSIITLPARLLLQSDLPVIADRLQSMPGADWIHLLAFSIIGWVIIPRFVLFLIARYRIARSIRRASPQLDTDYYRDLIFELRSNNSQGTLLFYGYSPDSQQRRQLFKALQQEAGLSFGDDTRVSTVEWGEAWTTGSETSNITVVFNGLQTPESDIHNEFLEDLQRQMGEPPLVIIDLIKLDEKRYQSRRSIWDSHLGSLRPRVTYRFLSAQSQQEEGSSHE